MVALESMVMVIIAAAAAPVGVGADAGSTYQEQGQGYGEFQGCHGVGPPQALAVIGRRLRANLAAPG